MNRVHYDPFEHAEQLGLPVHYDDGRLAPDELGLYLPRTRSIVLRPFLSTALERTVLAHELGHAHYDHRETTRRTEILADLYAAEHLVDMHELVDVLRCSPDICQWANDLLVTPRILRLYVNVHRPEIENLMRGEQLARLAS